MFSYDYQPNVGFILNSGLFKFYTASQPFGNSVVASLEYHCSKKDQYCISCLQHCDNLVVTLNLVSQHFLLTVCPVYMLGQHNYKASVINFQE